jgi:glutamyl-tRNA synthetase
MNDQIKTRFAPSPTGSLHVGGARTALFNFLFARKNNGLFHLRIEDTDLKRSTEEMSQRILTGLQWLGLKWDGEITHQAGNIQRHQEVAGLILKRKLGYHCFCTEQDLKVHRKDFKYNRHCLHFSSEEVNIRISQRQPYSLRFKVSDGYTTWKDLIHKKISIRNEEIEDFIILRSDNTPTYNLAAVVDDHDMGINYIIRGDDHISNTPKQILLYQAFGWKIPEFAHVPLILGFDKKRLSKRHGATSLEEYRDKGILPEAFSNFLVLLGWSPDDNREIMSLEEILEAFTLDTISKKSAIFDEKKLGWMNQQYLINKDSVHLYDDIMAIWSKESWGKAELQSYSQEELLSIIDLLKKRATYLNDFKELAKYFFTDPQDFEHQGFQKYMSNEQSWSYIEKTIEVLTNLRTFLSNEIEQNIRKLADSIGIPAGKIIHPLRLALTGRSASPGLFEVMEILGKQRVINRLGNFLARREEVQKQILDSRE